MFIRRRTHLILECVFNCEFGQKLGEEVASAVLRQYQLTLLRAPPSLRPTWVEIIGADNRLDKLNTVLTLPLHSINTALTLLEHFHYTAITLG